MFGQKFVQMMFFLLFISTGSVWAGDATQSVKDHRSALTLNVPLDPGPSGMTTLLGVDTDNNQVRDDVQRYIMLTYPLSPRVQQALFSMAKTYQEALTVPDQEAAALVLAHKQSAQRACLMGILGIREAQKVAQGLFSEQMNTLKRQKAYSRYQHLFSGAAFELLPTSQWLKACDFDVSDISD